MAGPDSGCDLFYFCKTLSDLGVVTSRENANLSTIKTGSIVPREISSLSLGCPVNSMKPMLVNNKETNKKQPVSPPPPPQPTTCAFLPSSRNCRPSSVTHLTAMHLTHRWPPNSLCAPRAHRQLQRLQFVYK